MSSELSNSLADLAERVREAQSNVRDAERTAASRAIDAGRMLCEAKEQCRHGEWLPFLHRADMPERQAQRMMKLARSGLKSDTVTDLGGVKAALAYLADFELPETGELLFIGEKDRWRRPNRDNSPLVVVLPTPDHPGFFNVHAADPGRDHPAPRKSLRGESVRIDDGSFMNELIDAIDDMLPVPHADRKFGIINDKFPPARSGMVPAMPPLETSPQQSLA